MPGNIIDFGVSDDVPDLWAAVKRVMTTSLAIDNLSELRSALAAGLETCATIVENGSCAPGTILDLCSAEFCDAFDDAPLVIAKGQANYETLSEAGPRVFCLLQARCSVIADDMRVSVGSAVVRRSTESPAR